MLRKATWVKLSVLQAKLDRSSNTSTLKIWFSVSKEIVPLFRFTASLTLYMPIPWTEASYFVVAKAGSFFMMDPLYELLISMNSNPSLYLSPISIHGSDTFWLASIASSIAFILKPFANALFYCIYSANFVLIELIYICSFVLVNSFWTHEWTRISTSSEKRNRYPKSWQNTKFQLFKKVLIYNSMFKWGSKA